MNRSKEAELRATREERLARAREVRHDRDLFNDLCERAVTLVELESLVTAQMHTMLRMRKELNKLRELHHGYEWVRHAAADLDLDSTTLNYAFYSWLDALTPEQVLELKSKSGQRKKELKDVF